MHLGGRTAGDPSSVAGLFREYFSELYVPSSGTCIQHGMLSTSSFSMGSVDITEAMVARELQSLDVSKGMGPDGVPPVLLRSCRESLTYPIFVLFRRSLESGVFPSSWKSAFITPIPKTSERSKINGYRPVCSLSTLPKTLERLMVKLMTPALRNQLPLEQHGFVAGRSCASNLLTFQEFVLDAFSEGLQVDCIYTDFSKAFDRVDHRVLIEKLSSFGFHGVLLRWFEDYLRGRSMMVRVKSTCSEPFVATSGVPQGSHLGPLMFLIFVSDIGRVLSQGVSHLVFADDLKIFTTIRDEEDCGLLQESLESLGRWCVSNRLCLNTGKCSVVSFSRSSSPILTDYVIGGVLLRRGSSMRDLGVLFDNRLAFSDHVDQVCSKGMKMLGFVKRSTRNFRDSSALLALYTALVRPLMEFSTVVWSPGYGNARQALERVQRRFLRYLSLRSGVPWEDFDCGAMMAKTGLDSLELRRELFDVLFLQKLIRNEVDSSLLLSRLNFYAPPYRTRQNQVFYMRSSPTNYLINRPLSRMQRLYNRVASDVDALDDLLQAPTGLFKRSVREVLRRH
ncbi:WD repeat domain 59 [Nesidiocoris tenuis]|uniref:WD repeat domain 59 n=1 Tax=Nesidiocoris tenuis TaxID=355587 RepID=A0ABN7ATE0_9HEMI|nr:WD repeat domain 59 [Nesidiocoris tenuis]